MAEVLTQDSEFIVTDSTFINLFVAAFFFLMVISSFVYNSGSTTLDMLMLFGLVPGIIFTVKAFVKKTAITINKSGIFFYNAPVTDWKHFKAASAKQMPLGIGRFSDNVVLTIEYYKDSVHGFYKKSIPLASTQNKSEEAIIAAIEFFYGLSQNIRTAD